MGAKQIKQIKEAMTRLLQLAVDLEAGKLDYARSMQKPVTLAKVKATLEMLNDEHKPCMHVFFDDEVFGSKCCICGMIK